MRFSITDSCPVQRLRYKRGRPTCLGEREKGRFHVHRAKTCAQWVYLQVRVLPRLRWRGDVEPKHQCLGRLPLFEYLGTGKGSAQTRARAWERQRQAWEWKSSRQRQRSSWARRWRSTDAGVDLWRRLYERIIDLGHLQRENPRCRWKRDCCIDAVSCGGFRLPLPGTVPTRSRGGCPRWDRQPEICVNRSLLKLNHAMRGYFNRKLVNIWLDKQLNWTDLPWGAVAERVSTEERVPCMKSIAATWIKNLAVTLISKTEIDKLMFTFSVHEGVERCFA